MALGSIRGDWEGSIFVDGTFRASSSGETLTVLEKATGEPLGTVGMATTDDLETAMALSKKVQAEWAAQPYNVRADLLRKVADLIAERADDIAELIVRETGSIRGKAQYEVGGAIDELEAGAALAARPSGEILQSHDPNRLSLGERVPVGVVATITPWNFPLILAMRVIGPAIGLGNSIVLKPSPETPISGGLLVADLFAEAGAPAGLVQVMTGDIAFSEALVAHPDVNMIHFTGSSAVGAKIAATAGGQLKRVSLELGGNNALVVFDDFDVDKASMIGAWSSFHYQGQTCITAGRHIVHENIFDEYVEKLAARAAAISVGDPKTDQVGLGPMINERQCSRGKSFLEDSVAAGAKVVAGGEVDGLFFKPSVVTGLTPDMPLWTQEIFAPVAPVVSFSTEEQALEMVNSTNYGLVNSVLTGDEGRGLRFARKVRSGMVHVNDATPLDEANAPFGGIGASGLGGRAGGEANLEEFTERRWVTVQQGEVEFPY